MGNPGILNSTKWPEKLCSSDNSSVLRAATGIIFIVRTHHPEFNRKVHPSALGSNHYFQPQRCLRPVLSCGPAFSHGCQKALPASHSLLITTGQQNDRNKAGSWRTQPIAGRVPDCGFMQKKSGSGKALIKSGFERDGLQTVRKFALFDGGFSRWGDFIRASLVEFL